MVKISDDNCDFIEEDEDTEEVKSQEEPAPEQEEMGCAMQ